MSESPRFPPYEGRADWSQADHHWVIVVTHAHGGRLPIQGIFESQLLQRQLQDAGVKAARVALNRDNFTCLVWSLEPPEMLRHQEEQLLAVLRKHYAHFKGRSVNWTVG